MITNFWLILDKKYQNSFWNAGKRLLAQPPKCVGGFLGHYTLMRFGHFHSNLLFNVKFSHFHSHQKVFVKIQVNIVSFYLCKLLKYCMNHSDDGPIDCILLYLRTRLLDKLFPLPTNRFLTLGFKNHSNKIRLIAIKNE